MTKPAPGRPGTQPLADKRAWIALAVLALPLLLVSMDVSVLYFAVPAIVHDLHASATEQLWILDVYGFVLAASLVTMGALADRLGAKQLLLVGAFGFSATSVLAACAANADLLIAARALLGIAGATLMPSTLALVRLMFRNDGQRAKAVGIWTGVMTGGIALGPVLSGLLLEHFWWGSVFLINIPAMALLLLTGPPLLPATPAHRGVRFDLTSAALSLVAVLATVYGVKEWAASDFSMRWPASVAVGLALGMLFVRRQLSHTDSLVPTALLRNGSYLGAVGSNAVATFALVGNAVFVTTYLQLVLGKEPLVAALWSLAPSVVVGGVVPASSALVLRSGARAVVTGGFLVAAAGFGVLTRVGDDSLALVLCGATLLGSGLVAVMTTAGERLLFAVTPDQAGVGSAVSEATSELGGALGIALLGSLGTAIYRTYAHAHLPPQLAGGPAGDSLAGALGVAPHTSASTADAVVSTARTGYVHGLHGASLAGAALLLLAALAAGWRRGPR